MTESAAAATARCVDVIGKELVADQLAADQEHARVDQPRRQAEGKVDRTAIDDLFDLHQLVARDAERVSDRIEQRYAEHRPGRVAHARAWPDRCRPAISRYTIRTDAISDAHMIQRTWLRSLRVCAFR